MMNCEFRPGTPDDSAAIFEVVCDAFNRSPDEPRCANTRRMCEGQPHQYMVLQDDGGRIVAALHVGDTWIQVGRCAVLKGDVGHVSVRSALQGRGLGTLLMRETVRWMTQRGCHLSRLGGLVQFYNRFGYERFPRRFVEFRLDRVQCVSGFIPAAEAFREPTGLHGALRPYDEARDWRARAELAFAFNEGRSGAARVSRDVSPPASPAPPDPEALHFVHELGGQVMGYLFAAESPLEAREGEVCFSIGDFAYRPDCPEAAGALLLKLFAHIAHRAPLRVISRLPCDEDLINALQEAGVAFECIELYQGAGANMIKVLNLKATLEAVLPELVERLGRSVGAGWRGAIAFALPDQRAVLDLRGPQPAVHDDGPCALEIGMTQAEFVKALFGISGIRELACFRRAEWGGEEAAVLDALFPRCAAGAGPWG